MSSTGGEVARFKHSVVDEILDLSVDVAQAEEVVGSSHDSAPFGLLEIALICVGLPIGSFRGFHNSE